MFSSQFLFDWYLGSIRLFLDDSPKSMDRPLTSKSLLEASRKTFFRYESGVSDDTHQNWIKLWFFKTNNRSSRSKNRTINRTYKGPLTGYTQCRDQRFGVLLKIGDQLHRSWKLFLILVSRRSAIHSRLAVIVSRSEFLLRSWASKNNTVVGKSIDAVVVKSNANGTRINTCFSVRRLV